MWSDETVDCLGFPSNGPHGLASELSHLLFYHVLMHISKNSITHNQYIVVEQ